jgi:TolA-binding protein
LGWSFFEKKQYDKAAEYYELALPGIPKELAVVAPWQAGESQLRNKEFARASVHYQTVIKAGKTAEINLIRLQEQAWLRLGYSQAQEKKWAESEKTYAQFVKDYPKHVGVREALKGIGFACQQMQQYDKALLVLQKVVSDETRDELGAEAQFLRGECYLDQKKYDQAIAEYIKVSLYPFKEWQAKGLYELAVALERKGEPVKARDQFNRLIMQYPGTTAAKVAKAAREQQE